MYVKVTDKEFVNGVPEARNTTTTICSSVDEQLLCKRKLVNTINWFSWDVSM